MKKAFLLIGTLLCLLWPLAGMAAKQASGTISMEFDLSEQPAGQEAKLWIPYPLSDDDQLVTKVSISGDFAESAVYSDQKYSTPMLYARWDKEATSRKLVFSFHAVRNEVVKKDFPDKEGTWNPADYTIYLSPTSLGPIDGIVKDLADKIVADKTFVYDKAKAIYDWICENMYRDPETKGCGPGDVCSLLATPGGKCTDIHSVFVALARAVGVPAREVFGIRQGKESVVDITKWQHCWAEFFLPGYGWVPVDPADVRKMMLKHDLKLEDKKTKEYREYFWGAWDQYRVKLAVGRDLLLNPPQAGKPLNTFGYPYAEVGGEIIDWLDPASFKYTITYTK
ncbi:transglutaminase-like domain-containing protein [Desulfopila sp. IMCC35008]|uniref:transglutaminase-like domain-containing protein n=1 Tax=Desulfopila sp. IMCC35008 TaxID=2653858 RepID=UPI0013D43C91|nr:transglutaminase domain-containing protein [Desulfopila sp. IMCC35008]